MGIRHLETYVCSEVRNGYVEINIESEIKQYYASAKKPNPSPPVIVIDLMSLYRPVCYADLPGLLCGGRFNQVAHLLEQFFTRLNQLGAKLVFFYDGPIQDTKYDTWTQRQDDKYIKMMEIIESVDRLSDLAWMANRFRQSIPNNTLYPVRQIAAKHGELMISIAKECDQELAAYANQVQAIAIISNDTDFMIYKGFWRYWSAKDINFDTLDTMEYNRLELVRKMGLSFKQMRLLATLGGNDIIRYEEVRHFHSKLGNPRQKFPRLADFVRQQALPESLHQDNVLHSLLNQAFGKAAVNEDLKKRFLASLDFYDIDYQPQNTNITNDPVIAMLLKLENTFLFQIWSDRPVNVTAFFADMRRGEFGEQFPQLVIPIVARQMGIALYHRQMFSDCSTRRIVIKMSHEAGHSIQDVTVEFPQHVAPPPLLDLLSQQSDIQTSLQNIKRQLYAWIASDTLDYRRLQSVPDRLLAPVVTLYYLVEQRILDVFEADVLLQVSHDVVFQTYDFQVVKYPTKLGKRPFRIAFLYLKIYNHFSKSRSLFGWDEDSFLCFDGVLFHNRYEEATKHAVSLAQIQQWRIYDGLIEK